jgi:ankyrin repeat protein
MYEIYNCILNQRSHPADPDKLWDTYQNNRFPTTLWAIVSAIQKLGASTPLNLGEKLYRGNGGSQWLPGRFVDRDDLNVRGMTALSFQSFSASREKALEYAKPDGPLPMVLVIQPSVDPLNGFADIAQFSQNPDERERVLPPLAWFYPDSTLPYRIEVPQKGTVEFVPIRVTVCRSPCLEELERRKRNMHITEFANRVAELHEALQSTARKRNAADRLQTQNEQTQMQFWEKQHTVDTLIASIVKKVEDVLERHRNIDFTEFNKKRYVAIVQESLDCVRMAPSLLKLWLMDETQHIHMLSNYSLLQGHRWYISFLKRKYESDPDNRKLARKLCKHLGLLDINDLSQGGKTPLMNAAEFGRTEEALEYLVASGEDIHATKDDGECCLHLAADIGHDHCIRALVRLGAAIDQPYKNGFTALHRACINAHYHSVATLASLKADVNKRCAQGRTPLLHAAQRGYVKCIEELARHGANLDQCGFDMFTPLYMACQNGKKMCVAALLALGAKVNLDLPMRTSPLWVASKNGFFEVVNEFKSVPHAVLFPPELLSPLNVAISSKHLACVDALLQLHPPVQCVFIALFAATWFRDLASIRCILDAGAVRGLDLLQTRDEDGLTPEQFAELCCCDESELALLRGSAGAHARANAPSAVSPLPISWNVAGKSVCVTRNSTLRFYSYDTEPSLQCIIVTFDQVRNCTRSVRLPWCRLRIL